MTVRMDGNSSNLEDLPVEVIAATYQYFQEDDIEPEHIRIIDAVNHVWPSNALGLPENRMHTQRVIPGYILSIIAAGQFVALHVSTDGAVVREGEGFDLETGVNFEPPVDFSSYSS